MDSSILTSIPKEQLEKIPGGFPPPGVTSNLAHPHSTGNAFYAVGSLVMVVMFVFVSLRFYAKISIWRKLSADDYTTILAVIGTTAFFAAACCGVKYGKYGTHTWDLTLAQVISNDTIIPGFFVSWVSNIPRAFAKASFLIMYLEIFKPFRWFRWLVYVGLAVTAGFHLAVLIIQLYYASPAPGQPWITVLLSTRFSNLFRTTVPLVAGGFVIDIYILVIPMFAIRKLALSRSKKSGLAFIFATGSIACIASALNIYYSYQLKMNPLDFSYHLLPTILTTIVELCIGIACSSMPACARLYRMRKSHQTKTHTTLPGTGGPSAWSRLRSSQDRATANEKSMDVTSKDDIEFGNKPWSMDPHGIKTVVHVARCPSDVEQGHIYVKRNFHQHFVVDGGVQHGANQI